MSCDEERMAREMMMIMLSYPMFNCLVDGPLSCLHSGYATALSYTGGEEEAREGGPVWELLDNNSIKSCLAG